MNNTKYEFDNSFNNKEIIGTDEVGRGPLAGPVVACSVYISEYFDKLQEINDSKKLTDKKRRKLYDILINSPYIKYEISIKDEKIIDEINILNASLLAMKESCEKLIKKCGFSNSLTLVDGNQKIKDYKYFQETVIKGDEKSLSIACASIIAKVFRDDIMIKYSEIYKNYDLEKNKGYGTKKHCEAIKKYGICDIHRKTFIKKILGD